MSFFSRIALSTLLQVSALTRSAYAHEHLLGIKFEDVDHVLPMPMSDMSATYDKVTNKIYIVGGCDDPQGNALQDWDGYACTSLTAKTYAYDADAGTFDVLPDAPRERYRHTAASVNGRIWLVGGRTVEDHLITEIDVLDTASKTWSTVGSLPPHLQMSDQASFALGDSLYVLGGYDSNYTATERVVSVNADAEYVSANGVVFVDAPSLAEARGDVHAVAVGNAAYVTGGYTHADGYCEPLVSTERFDRATNAWTTIGPLATGRADKALVVVNDHLYAVGGEAKHTCDGDPSEYTLALDDVEVLDASAHADGWTVLADAPARRFRFVGAPWPDTNSVYVLGGQTFYEPSCKCFATSDLISKYTETHHQADEDEDNDESAESGDTDNQVDSEETSVANVRTAVVASVLVTGLAAFGLF